jgi:hypothetical protein
MGNTASSPFHWPVARVGPFAGLGLHAAYMQTSHVDSLPWPGPEIPWNSAAMTIDRAAPKHL